MGVPKFYRWLSERYPQINQVISDSTLLPEFDNLYLDMNGIIHACTHPNDDNPEVKSLTFREMIQGIFAYIDRIVSEIVKPKKILFMAIDGVAPRAKLNQQRSRRFRSAQERLESIEKMKAKGIVVDEDNMFDSNCITPGTEFMDQVGKHLRWFIRKKMKESALWRNLEIVFSGHSVPGEGEHKIMQFIREKRALPNYEPNQRHCMYGQDADLIMLGLACHEPHFTLLREVVNFASFKGGGRGDSQRQTVIRQTKEAQFQLLHLSILREYIELDFGMDLLNDESNNDGFVVDKERLMDDFIFLTFFVGNDFLPHLPTLDISENAFDVIFAAYKYMLSKTRKYFVCNGEIADFDQLECFCAIIGAQENEILLDREQNEKMYAAKQRKYKDKVTVSLEEVEEHEESLRVAYENAKMQSTIDMMSSVSLSSNNSLSIAANGEHTNQLSHFVDTYFEDLNESYDEDDDDGGIDYQPFQEQRKKKSVSTRNNNKNNNQSSKNNNGQRSKAGNDGYDNVNTDDAAKDYRGRYYYEKFKNVPLASSDDILKSEMMSTLIQHYVEGLIWCLAYYIKGCISWTWYYPHHYGPMLQDMKRLTDIKNRISFQLGQPFLPFQQLLGCLPPGSRKLLPAVYQWLMTSSTSPVYEFYPIDFAVDMTHKKNPWEAVVLLPFIDEKILLEAEIKFCTPKNLTNDERARNSFGNVLIHTFNPNATETYFSCSHDIGFPDIHFCQSTVVEFYPSLSPGAYFKPSLIKGTKAFLPGFPTLTALSIVNMELSAIKLNVFGTDSKYKTLSIMLDSMEEKISAMLPDIVNNNSSTSQLPQTDDDIASAQTRANNEKKMLALLGKSVFVNYPQLHEAKIVAVTTEFREYRCHLNAITGNVENVLTIDYDTVTSMKWRRDSEEEANKYFKGRGTPGSGGLMIGNVLIRLKLVALQGMNTNMTTGERKKVFGKVEFDVPIQLALWNHVLDPRFVETDKMPLKALLPHRCEVIGLKGEYIGCKGYVIHEDESEILESAESSSLMNRSTLATEHKNSIKTSKSTSKSSSRVVTVEFLMPDTPEPQFGHAIVNTVQDEYFSSRDVCKALKINPDILGKIVGSIFVEPGRHDLGLNLKRNGQYQLLGCVRKVENTNESRNQQQNYGNKSREMTLSSVSSAPPPNVWGQVENVKLVGSATSDDTVIENVTAQWEYSEKGTALIAEYLSKFPVLFTSLARLPHKPKYAGYELFGPTCDKVIEAINEWMKAQPFFAMPRTLLSSNSMSKTAMVAVEKAGDMRTSYLKTHPLQPKIVRDVAVANIFRGDLFSPFDAPTIINATAPCLGDRVVNLTSTGVPIGLKGTVVTIHANTGFVEIIFDEEFVSGRGLQGNCSMFRGRLCPWTGVLKIPNTSSSTQFNGQAKTSMASKINSIKMNSESAQQKLSSLNVVSQSQQILTSGGSNSGNNIVLKQSEKSVQKASKIFEMIRPVAPPAQTNTAAVNTVQTSSSVSSSAMHENKQKGQTILSLLNKPMNSANTDTVKTKNQNDSKSKQIKSILKAENKQPSHANTASVATSAIVEVPSTAGGQVESKSILIKSILNGNQKVPSSITTSELSTDEAVTKSNILKNILKADHSTAGSIVVIDSSSVTAEDNTVTKSNILKNLLKHADHSTTPFETLLEKAVINSEAIVASSANDAIGSPDKKKVNGNKQLVPSKLILRKKS